MKGVRTGTGLALGAGFGMLVGLLADVGEMSWWLLGGAAIGLIGGSILEARSNSDDPG